MHKFKVKRRQLSPAKRNPFRPSQRLKRGRWVTLAEFATYEEALARAKTVAGGMREVAIYHHGTLVIEDAFGRLPATFPEPPPPKS